jgi:hypothetical protein
VTWIWVLVVPAAFALVGLLVLNWIDRLLDRRYLRRHVRILDPSAEHWRPEMSRLYGIEPRSIRELTSGPTE